MAKSDLFAEAEKARSRRWRGIILASMIAGFVSGFGFVALKQGDGFLTGTIPAWLGWVLALLYLVTMIAGSIAMRRVADELEMHNNLWGLAIGASALIFVYPPWWLLWRGEVLPEPTHEGLFLLLFVATALGYGWKKYL